jgi:hypothetical protein
MASHWAQSIEDCKIIEDVIVFSFDWPCMQKSRRTTKVETGTRGSVDAANNEWLQVLC